MDETDTALLRLLSKNARMPVATLAKRLGLARSTVQARLERLEVSGVIAGYTLRLGAGVLARRIRATVLLQIEPRSTAAVLSRLASMDEVETASTASGRFDLILQVSADGTSALDRALDAIGAIDGVRATESLIQLSTKIDRAP
ncbi:MAG: Lrp/AsnC family transcriptional regulator [Pseudomonadota bacterium]